MALDTSTSFSPQFGSYEQIVVEYRQCVVRCEQAIDQLRACKRELRELGGASSDHASVPHLGLDHAVSQLSQRELQVFALIGQGFATHQIAQRLRISTSTVETYRERLKGKLAIDNGTALVRYAVLWLCERADALPQ